jgi:HAD superfamily hydrolase (TIGR01549 family)
MASRGRRAAPAGVAQRLADRFSAYRDEHMRLFPDAHNVIDALRARGTRLALVTNGASEAQRAKIDRFDLANRFEHTQIEGEHAFGKPDERAYLHALRQLGADARDTWMVGDNLEWERDALQRMGRARSIVAVGPMAGLLVGGIVAELWGPRPVFMALAVIALTALMFAAQLPTAADPVHQQRPRFAAPDAFSIWSFCMGFALDGLFVFGLSLLAVAGLGRSGVIAASVAMALRYVSEILLSPAGGRLAHRCGARRMLVALSWEQLRRWLCWEHPSHFYGSACCRL